MPKRRGNQEGNIYFDRKRSLWVGDIMLGYREVVDPATGEVRQKRNRLKFYGKQRREVQEKLAEVVSSRAAGTFVEPSKLTTGEWFRRWLTDYKKMRLRAKTYESYESMARLYIIPSVGHIPLKELRPDHLQALYRRMKDAGKSARTIRYLHAILHAGLNQALQNGLVARNAADATKPPAQEQKGVKILSPDEEHIFVEALKEERLAAVFILCLNAGLRRGEVLALKWDDVDFQRKEIRIKASLSRTKETGIEVGAPKTKASIRTVPLNSIAYRALREHKKQQNEEKLRLGDAYNNQGFVFANELGGPIEPRNLERSFYRIINRTGLKINLHGLRHTFASRLIEKGADPKTVAELLGHTTVTMTLNSYTHPTSDRKREAVALLAEGKEKG